MTTQSPQRLESDCPAPAAPAPTAPAPTDTTDPAPGPRRQAPVAESRERESREKATRDRASPRPHRIRAHGVWGPCSTQPHAHAEHRHRHRGAGASCSCFGFGPPRPRCALHTHLYHLYLAPTCIQCTVAHIGPHSLTHRPSGQHRADTEPPLALTTLHSHRRTQAGPGDWRGLSLSRRVARGTRTRTRSRHHTSQSQTSHPTPHGTPHHTARPGKVGSAEAQTHVCTSRTDRDNTQHSQCVLATRFPDHAVKRGTLSAAAPQPRLCREGLAIDAIFRRDA